MISPTISHTTPRPPARGRSWARRTAMLACTMLALVAAFGGANQVAHTAIGTLRSLSLPVRNAAGSTSAVRNYTPPAADGPVCTNFITRTTADGLGNNDVFGVNATGATVYAATVGGFGVSTDGGNSFTNKTAGLGSNVTVGVSSVGSNVYVATTGGVSISADGGNTFINKTTADGLGSNSIRGIFAMGNSVYAATSDNGLSISTDGGNTFINKTTADGLGNNSLFNASAVGSTVYAATRGGLGISTDGGTTFVNKTTANGLGDNEVYGISVQGSTIYAATRGGLGISTDGGATFINKTSANGLGNDTVYDVYSLGNTVYAATANGFSISTDGGNNFTNYTTADGLAGNTVRSVFATSTRIVVGTSGGFSTCPPPATEINVKGNATTIVSGDTTPTTTDGTDFGSAAANTGANANYFTIENLGPIALNLTGTPKVTVSGTNASDFTIARQPTSPVGALSSTTFLVNFAPTATGTRTATISIANDDSDENPYTFAIQGTGTPAPANGPSCSLYGNRTTANGLGNNLVNGVYVVGSTVYAATGVGVSISTDGGTTFTNKTTTNGLGNNAVNGVYAVGSTVYAATAGGLSISTDGGATFTNKTTADGLGTLFTRGVYAVGSTVYVATNGGLSISTDGGTSFTSKTTTSGLGGNGVNGVYVVGSMVYAATTNGLSISTDGGVTFINKTTTNGLGNNNVNVVYVAGSTVYAATSNGLSISTDGGASFTNKTTTNGLGNIRVLGVYALGNTVYAATAGVFSGGGLSISTDGGGTFANYKATDGLGDDGVRSVFATATAVYAGTAGGLSFCPPPPPEINVKGNNTSIVSGDTTPTTTDGTDFGSAAANIGANANYFTIENTGAGPLTLTGTPKVALSGTNASDFSIALQPASLVTGGSSTTFLVNFAPTATGTRTATISIANNDTDENPYTFAIQGTGTPAPANGPACTTFANRSSTDGLGSNTVRSVYVVGSTVYAGTTGGLSISTDGGVTFTNKTTANGLGSNVVISVYVVGTTVYAGTSSGLSISTDGGATFTNKTTANGLGNNFVNAVFAVGSTVYAATDGGLSISTNGGTSFSNKTTTSGLGANGTNGVYVVGSTVYAATSGGLSISTDGGASFINKTTTNGLAHNVVNDVFVAGSTVYAATGSGLSISTNGGTSFTTRTTTNGLGNNAVNRVFALGSTVYAATDGGLSISTDGGTSFTNYNFASGLSGNTARSVFATATALYAGTGGGLSFCPPTPPMMVVKGNSTTIANGDTTPAVAADTDFGSVSISLAHTFTITNTGLSALNLTGTPKVAISGTNATDFTVTALPTSPVATSTGTTTFQITFTPGAVGLRTATISIASDDPNNNPYTFAIQGTGSNTAPTITPLAAGIVPGVTKTNVKIATVADAQDAVGTLQVTVTSANPSNGITLSNLVNQGGMIFATITAANNATQASFTLQVKDSGNLANTAALTVSALPLTAKVGDPAVCLDPGGLIGVEATVTNANPTAQVSSWTATLPTALTAVAGTCAVAVSPAGGNPGTCTIAANGGSLSWNGSLAAGQTVTIVYRTRLNGAVANGTQLCIDNQGTVGNANTALTYCFTVDCPVAENVPLSDTKAGSILVFPYYTSTIGGASDTRMTISNISNAASTTANQSYVHLFFIDGTTCNQADLFLCLTPNASFSFKASEYDPGNTGYVLAVAVDKNGLPVNNNVLIGSAFVNTPTLADSYGAEAFRANGQSFELYTQNGNTATLYFDHTGYDAVPRQFAVEIQSPAEATGQQVVTAGLSGNLLTAQMTGAAQVGTGLAFNEKEAFASFNGWLTGVCQARGTITGNSPRVPNGLGNLLKTGQAGYLKFNIGAGVGVLLTPQTATWKGIRTLHKTQTTTTTLTIPILVPVC